MARKWFSGRKLKGLASDTKPSTPETDSEFFETDTKKTFDFTGGSWVERVAASGVDSSTTLNAYNETIANYTQPSVSASSSIATALTSGTVTVNNGSSGNYEYIAQSDTSATSAKRYVNLSTFHVGKKIYIMSMLAKRNSYSGWNATYTMEIQNSSGVTQITSPTTRGSGGFAVEPSAGWATFDVTTGGVNGTGYTVQTGDKLYIKCISGSNGTPSAIYVSMPSASGQWKYTNTIDDQIQYIDSHVRNNDTTGESICKTQQETAPYISVGISSTTDVEGVSIYLDSGNTETQFDIQTSTDNSNWTKKRTILTSNLTAGQWNFVRINIHLARYIKILGSSGNSKVMSINELKILHTQSLNVNHGHSIIDKDDNSLGLNGI
jgi:hypothetical protein